MKKFVSLALALVMVLALSIPAFASDTSKTVDAPGGTATTNVAATINELTVKVTVPTTGEVIVNPYKMAVTVGEGDDAAENKAQIIAAPLAIVSESDIALSVDVTVSAKAAKGSGVVFATAPISTATKVPTTKSVFMYLDAKVVDDEAAAAAATAAAYDKTSKTQVAVSTSAVTKAGILTLPAGTEDAASVGAVVLAGDAVEAPATSWTESDTFDVTIVFSFNPIAAE